MKQVTRDKPASVSDWLDTLSRQDTLAFPALAPIYGSTETISERIYLVSEALTLYRNAFGNDPVHVFRSPGRINLRGMHVDTHGGYINPTTLGRETVVVAAKPDDNIIRLRNRDNQARPVEFAIGDGGSDDGWERYVRGCVRAVGARFPDTLLHGLRGVVASDVPFGAGLSSSASLCTALITTLLQWNGLKLSRGQIVETVRDAEWHAGARCGLGDPAAMMYGSRNTVTRMAFDGDCGEPATVASQPWPEHLKVIVADSNTQRNIAGHQRVAYSANRAAYSCALELLRRTLTEQGVSHNAVESLKNFRDCSQDHLESLMNGASMYTLFQRVPEHLPLDELKNRLGSAAFDEAFAEHLGDVDPEHWPKTCRLRGPLVFGLAENERAAAFLAALRRGDDDYAGNLMTIGHDGDRVSGGYAARWPGDVSDHALERLAQAGTSLAECPGAYGASTPCLDAIVDSALHAGALGASLTGAGMGGSVVALCRTDDARNVADCLREYLASESYAHLARFHAPLDRQTADASVMVNRSVAAAGELSFPA